MGYSPNPWVSPYTYNALYSFGDPIAPSIFSSKIFQSNLRPEWIKKREKILFLRFWIDKEIKLFPSFTYEAFLMRIGDDSSYEIHLLDNEGTILSCVRLQTPCNSCSEGCESIELFGEVFWNDRATKIVVRKDEEDLKSFEIEKKVSLRAKASRQQDGNYKIEWEAEGESGPLTYLVQWQDNDGSWRGVAPRTNQTSVILPKNYLFIESSVLNIRVLAVHLLNTSTVDIEIQSSKYVSGTSIHVIFLEDENLFRAFGIDGFGRSIPNSDLIWYDENGGEIIRGSDLIIRNHNLKGSVTVRTTNASKLLTEGFALLGAQKEGVLRCGSKKTGRKFMFKGK